MPQPTRGMVHIDRALTNISVAYIQQAENFVAHQVFPPVPVQKQSDRYFVYLKEDWFRDEAIERAPATESAGGMYEIDNTPNYFCRKYGFHKNITEEDRANADEPLRPDIDATQFVTQKLLLRKEIVWANTYFTPGGALGARTSPWGAAGIAGTMSGMVAGPGANQFLAWNQIGSFPIQDVTDAKLAITSQTGYRPNILVLGPRVYEALRNHDDILGRIVFTQRGLVTPDILAQLMDVERVVVAWAVRNTAPKGAAETTNFIIGDHALLVYAAPSPGIYQPSAGYTFAWAGLMGASSMGSRIVRLPMPHLGMGTERIEGELAFDMQMVADDLGVFFADAFRV